MTPDELQKRATTRPGVPGLRIVRLLAPLVPSTRRADWLAEWEGELHHAWHQRASRPDPLLRPRLTIRSLGAFADALWLRRHHGANNMLGTDLRYALRTMRRRPGFATIVVLTLALGIGATTAIFSIVNGVLLRPLPFPEPDRLYAVRGHPVDGNPEKVGPPQSYPDFIEYREGASSFSGMTAMRTHPATLIDGVGEPRRVMSTFATGEGWTVLRTRAHIGRLLLPSDDLPGAPPVGILSHSLWQSRYGGDPGIIGRTIALNGEPVTVVGVVPPDFRLVPGDVWRPLVPDRLDAERGAHRLFVIGRLAPDATAEEAEAELRVVARRLELEYPGDNTNRGVRLEALHDAIVGDTRPALLILLGAVSLVLLIGCANLASLFLARASSREREIAVRAALGAGRGRLVRQFLTESLLLALVGGVAGLAVAWAGMRALIAWVPRTVPRASEIALDVPVLLFLLVISGLVGIAFGVLPGLQLRNSATRTSALREGTRGSTSNPGARRLRHGLVVAEVALATILVVGAALLLQSFWRLHSAAPGFSPDGLVVTQIQLPLASYDSTAKVTQFYERLQEEVAALPGVEAVAVAFEHPLGPGWTSSYTLADRDPPPRGQEPESRIRPVWPGYFRAVGVPILRGRDIAESDRMGAPGVVVVNEAFVRRHFPGGDAIGKQINRTPWWPGAPASYEIVGVVADEPFMGRGQPGDPATYFSHAQFPMNDMYLVVRAAGDPMTLAPALRERIWRVDANLPVERIASMRTLLGDSVAEPRFNAALLGLFALAALLLAAIGIYGVLSYTVAQRTNEIGVRMALGAERWSVIRLVVGEGIVVAMLGIALGLAGALALSRTMDSMLHGGGTRDPMLFGGVAAVLATVALLAAYLPALRASRIEPVVALRYD